MECGRLNTHDNRSLVVKMTFKIQKSNCGLVQLALNREHGKKP